ncbi:MAG: hypothetical protein OK454_06405, partial [Thaumarchaeota archaeon]|nr:hypothetical protein [Nitrososphaerota archaeon]
MAEVDEAQRIREVLWGEISTKGMWPSKKAITRTLLAEGIDFDKVPLQGTGILVQEVNDSVTVRLRAEGSVLDLPAVKDLCEPVTRAIQLGIERFTASPPYVEEPNKPSITFEEMVVIWGTPERARLFARLIADWSPFPIYVGAHTADLQTATLGTHLDILRYRNVQTLREVRELKMYSPRINVGDKLEGTFLLFLQRVFNEACATRRWPIALDFTVRNLALGFTPDLMRDLHPRFIHENFGWSRTSRIIPRLGVLEFLDPDQSIRNLLPKVAQELAGVWTGVDDVRYLQRSFE